MDTPASGSAPVGEHADDGNVQNVASAEGGIDHSNCNPPNTSTNAPHNATPPVGRSENSEAFGSPTNMGTPTVQHELMESLERAFSFADMSTEATEARTLLPGVDLREHLGMQSLAEEDDTGGGAALPVLKTPRGYSLGEAISASKSRRNFLETTPEPMRSPSILGEGGGAAATMPSGASLARISSLAWQGTGGEPTSRSPFLPSSTMGGVTWQLDDQPTPILGQPTPWQALMAKLSRGSMSPLNNSLPTAPPTESETSPYEMKPSMGRGRNFTPPPMLLIPEDNTPEGGLGTLAPASPQPMVTPGAPESVPIEAKAEVVTKLWPMLAPFAPQMLRRDILSGDAPGHFVRAAEPSTSSSDGAGTSGTSGSLLGDKSSIPTARPFQGALAVADISGFTALTQLLSKEGPVGVDLLAKCMNSYFSQLIDLVLSHGGDISKFAGDALLLVFLPTPEEEAQGGVDGGLKMATYRAAACMKELVEKLGFMKMKFTGETRPVARSNVRRVGTRYYEVESLRKMDMVKPREQPAKPKMAARGAAAAFAKRLAQEEAEEARKASVTSAHSGGAVSNASATDDAQSDGSFSTQMSGRMESVNEDTIFVDRADGAEDNSTENPEGTVGSVAASRALSQRLQKLHGILLQELVALFSGTALYHFRPPDLPEGFFSTNLQPGASSSIMSLASEAETPREGTSQGTPAQFSTKPQALPPSPPPLPATQGGQQQAPVKSSPSVILAGRSPTIIQRGANIPIPPNYTSPGVDGKPFEKLLGPFAAAVSPKKPAAGNLGNQQRSPPLVLEESGKKQISELNAEFGRPTTANISSLMAHFGKVSSFTASSTPQLARNASQSRTQQQMTVAGSGEMHTLMPLTQNPELLSLKVTVTAGTLCSYRVGGLAEPTDGKSPETIRWEFFAADAPSSTDQGSAAARGPIAQLAEAEGHAKPGEVVLSSEAAALLKESAQGVALPDGVMWLKRLLPLNSTQSDERQRFNRVTSKGLRDLEKKRFLSLTAKEQVEAYKVLRCHVPYSVRHRVEIGHIDSVNEFRACTILFFGFPSLNVGANLNSVQTAARAVQARMHHDSGFFLQMRSDEKGFVALCAFGLPGRAHEDSPRRAIQSALAIVEALDRQGLKAVVGVTTGRLFCGVVGSQQRAEYTVYGDAINMAARLMVKASNGLGSVLCDESTRLLAGERAGAEFNPLEPMHVKGGKAPVQAFEVINQDTWGDGSMGTSPLVPSLAESSEFLREDSRDITAKLRGKRIGTHIPEKQAIIGRESELALVGARLETLISGGGGGAIFVEGVAGMGKTRFAEEIASREGLAPLRNKCIVLVGAGRTERQPEPFYPWRQVFRQAFALDKERSAARHNTCDARQKGQQQQHQQPTDVAIWLRNAMPEYPAWRSTLASALGLLASDLPEVVTDDILTDAGPRAAPGVAPSPMLRDFGRTRSAIARPDTASESLSGGGTARRDTLRSVSARNLDPGRPMATSPGGKPDHLQEISNTLRAEKVKGMFVGLLQGIIACHGPLFIVLDDLHIFDTSSWRLLIQILDSLRSSILVVGTLRPDMLRFLAQDKLSPPAAPRSGALPPHWVNPENWGSGGTSNLVSRLILAYYEGMLESDGVDHVVLKTFTLSEARQYLSAELQLTDVTNEACLLLHERAAGLPAYLYQIARILRQKAQEIDSNDLPIPDMWDFSREAMVSVRGNLVVYSVTPARVDRLHPDEQLTLKLASVMGRMVDEELLRAAHPRSPSRRRFSTEILALAAAGFLSKGAAGGGGSDSPGMWHFNEILVRDVVYDMIPIIQAAEMHARVAVAMEIEERRGIRSVPCDAYAFHWRVACSFQVAPQWRWSLKCAAAWEIMAANAVNKGSMRSACAMLANNCLRVAEILNDSTDATPGLVPVPVWRAAKWERCAAAAMLCLAADGETSALSDALVHSMRALVWLGFPLPWSKEYKESKGLFNGVVSTWKKVTGTFLKGKTRGGGGGGGKGAQRHGIVVDEAHELASLHPVLTRQLSLGSTFEEMTIESVSIEFLMSEVNEEMQRQREGEAVLRVLSMAVLASEVIDRGSVKYVLWACQHIAGGKVDQGSPLRGIHDQLAAALQGVPDAGVAEKAALGALRGRAMRLPSRNYLAKKYRQHGSKKEAGLE